MYNNLGRFFSTTSEYYCLNKAVQHAAARKAFDYENDGIHPSRHIVYSGRE